jgi:hypothetical protein
MRRSQVTAALQSSGARFRAVVGHHPVRSFGHHCHGERGDKGECEDLLWVRQANEEFKVGGQ